MEYTEYIGANVPAGGDAEAPEGMLPRQGRHAFLSDVRKACPA
jgi:hypothetical protein